MENDSQPLRSTENNSLERVVNDTCGWRECTPFLNWGWVTCSDSQEGGLICFGGGMDLMEFVLVLLLRNDRKDAFDSSKEVL